MPASRSQARSSGRSRHCSRGAGTAGKRLAADAALQRVRARVEELARHDPPWRGSCSWHSAAGTGRDRFVIAASDTTVMIRASRGFVDKVPLSEFTGWRGRSSLYARDGAAVVRAEIYDDASDAQEVPDALPSN